MKNEKEKFIYPTIGLLVSASLIYLTIYVGYCKNVIGDMIVLIMAMQGFIYSAVYLIRELFNQD